MKLQQIENVSQDTSRASTTTKYVSVRSMNLLINPFLIPYLQSILENTFFLIKNEV